MPRLGLQLIGGIDDEDAARSLVRWCVERRKARQAREPPGLADANARRVVCRVVAVTSLAGPAIANTSSPARRRPQTRAPHVSSGRRRPRALACNRLPRDARASPCRALGPWQVRVRQPGRRGPLATARRQRLTCTPQAGRVRLSSWRGSVQRHEPRGLAPARRRVPSRRRSGLPSRGCSATPIEVVARPRHRDEISPVAQTRHLGVARRASPTTDLPATVTSPRRLEGRSTPHSYGCLHRRAQVVALPPSTGRSADARTSLRAPTV